jgi:murein DD-endopeptidase MepM/ murein hydrolase activator NlpD
MLTRTHGRHAAARRHVAGPILLTGLLAATTLSVAVPEAAAALDGPRRPVEPSSATRSPVTPYRVLPAVRLKEKPPPPWQLPVSGYHLTGRFGQSSGLWSSTHTGLDFAAPEGTAIRSIGPGTVLSAAYDGAFGNKTAVRLNDGTVLWYCHQSSFGVRPGQRLEPGDLVGHVGSTGNTTGPHLHLEVHPGGGRPVDPEAWLPRHGLRP